MRFKLPMLAQNRTSETSWRSVYLWNSSVPGRFVLLSSVSLSLNACCDPNFPSLSRVACAKDFEKLEIVPTSPMGGATKSSKLFALAHVTSARKSLVLPMPPPPIPTVPCAGEFDPLPPNAISSCEETRFWMIGGSDVLLCSRCSDLPLSMVATFCACRGTNQSVLSHVARVCFSDSGLCRDAQTTLGVFHAARRNHPRVYACVTPRKGPNRTHTTHVLGHRADTTGGGRVFIGRKKHEARTARKWDRRKEQKKTQNQPGKVLFVDFGVFVTVCLVGRNRKLRVGDFSRERLRF